MKISITKILTLTGAAVACIFAASGSAQAADYCREYTRTVYVGSKTQEAYGTACLQPDGSWMIVGEGAMQSIPNNVSNVDYVIRDYNRTYVPERVIYYDEPSVRVYRSRPVAPVFIWNRSGHYYGSKYVSYNKPRYNNHGHKKWDNHHNRRDRHDNGRGHGRR